MSNTGKHFPEMAKWEYFSDATAEELQEILDLVDELSGEKIDYVLRWINEEFGYGGFYSKNHPETSWSGTRWYIDHVVKGSDW
jgi:hypothetical protein